MQTNRVTLLLRDNILQLFQIKLYSTNTNARECKKLKQLKKTYNKRQPEHSAEHNPLYCELKAGVILLFSHRQQIPFKDNNLYSVQ